MVNFIYIEVNKPELSHALSVACLNDNYNDSQEQRSNKSLKDLYGRKYWPENVNAEMLTIWRFEYTTFKRERMTQQHEVR